MDENPYRSPQETGYQVPDDPVKLAWRDWRRRLFLNLSAAWGGFLGLATVVYVGYWFATGAIHGYLVIATLVALGAVSGVVLSWTPPPE
jgi:hypothetical protein